MKQEYNTKIEIQDIGMATSSNLTPLDLPLPLKGWLFVFLFNFKNLLCSVSEFLFPIC